MRTKEPDDHTLFMLLKSAVLTSDEHIPDDLLRAYVTKTSIDKDERAAVEAHLFNCLECLQAYNTLFDEVSPIRGNFQAFVTHRKQMLAKPHSPIGRPATEVQLSRRSMTKVESRLPTVKIPRKVMVWLQQIHEEGFLSPVPSVQTTLDKINPAIAHDVARRGGSPAINRSHNFTNSQQRGALTTLTEIRSLQPRPAFTAIRSLNPCLTWTAVAGAEDYEVQVSQSLPGNKLREVWSGSVGRQLQCVLPEEAGLKPGGVYLWQVISHHGDDQNPLLPTGFAILTKRLQEEVAALEPDVAEEPLALISLYEAYGLYEEALQQIDKMMRIDSMQEQARTLKEKLLAQMYPSAS